MRDGFRSFTQPHATLNLLRFFFNASIGVFGLGFFAVMAVLIAGIFGWTRLAEPDLSATWVKMEKQRALGYALILIYVPLFFFLPDEAAYLIPALVGFYLLLVQFVTLHAVVFLSAALLTASFFGFITHDDQGRIALIWRGPVLNDIAVQQRRGCLASLVEAELRSRAPQDMIVVAENRPEMAMLMDKTYVSRLVYTVTRLSDGRLADTEGAPLPDNVRLHMIDRAEHMQERDLPFASFGQQIISTKQKCR